MGLRICSCKVVVELTFVKRWSETRSRPYVSSTPSETNVVNHEHQSITVLGTFQQHLLSSAMAYPNHAFNAKGISELSGFFGRVLPGPPANAQRPSLRIMSSPALFIEEGAEYRGCSFRRCTNGDLQFHGLPHFVESMLDAFSLPPPPRIYVSSLLES